MENLINYFPCGMLDRDQRTILTISLLNNNKIINKNYVNSNNLNKFYKSDNNNNNNNNNKLINNNKNHIKLYNNLNNINNNNNNDNEFKLIKTSTKILTKNRNKLKSLLICILILLLPSLAYAKPIHHHNMENSSNNGQDNIDFNQIPQENNKKCQLLQNVLTIARSGYCTIINEVNDYTRKIYSLDHLQHHKEWIHHHNEALDPKSGKLGFDNYHEPPPDGVVKHLYRTDINTEEKSVQELLNIYERFELILNGIQQIIKAKEDDGNFNVEHPSVMSFFTNQEKIIKELLQEIKMGLETLRIKIPEINNNIIDYKNDGFDWITIREYLKLLVYTVRAFNILLEHCQNVKI